MISHYNTAESVLSVTTLETVFGLEHGADVMSHGLALSLSFSNVYFTLSGTEIWQELI